MHNAILNASTLETIQANLTKQVLVSFTCIIPHTNFYSPSKAIVCCIGTDLYKSLPHTPLLLTLLMKYTVLFI